MVKGLEVFKEYFADFSEQYVLIGGAACDICFGEEGADFRATRDLDIVLVVEALTKEFGQRFWEFVRDGGYQRRAKKDGSPQFYRFEKPQNKSFPKMLELFGKSEFLVHPDTVAIPFHIDDAVSSLSAILLDSEYYQLLMEGRTVVDGISILNASYLIPFKVKAWLDLREKQKAGIHVDSRDIKRHRNDVLRMVSELSLKDRISLPASVKEELLGFIYVMREENPNLKNLGLGNVKLETIISRLEMLYF